MPLWIKLGTLQSIGWVAFAVIAWVRHEDDWKLAFWLNVGTCLFIWLLIMLVKNTRLFR